MPDYETIHNEPQTLLADLTKLNKEDYIFRGVEKPVYFAQPSALRPNGMKKNEPNFRLHIPKLYRNGFTTPKL